MEKKNGFEELLVPGMLLDRHRKAIANQYRRGLTSTFDDLEEVVALLEDIACGGYTPEKQVAVQHAAYEMMGYVGNKQWAIARTKMDAAKEVGRQVKTLALGKDLLALMGDYGEVPTSSHVDATTLEVGYWCVYGGDASQITRYTAELARQGCILVGLMRSLYGKEV